MTKSVTKSATQTSNEVGNAFKFKSPRYQRSKRISMIHSQRSK